jgi:hypothetical protein
MTRQQRRQACHLRPTRTGHGYAQAAPNKASLPPLDRRKERGAVTAEFAVALPAVLLLLALLLAGSAAGITQLRLEEAARAGARALARGDGDAAVEDIVRRLAGNSASAAVATEGEWLSVTVTGRVGGPVGSLIPWALTAKASARSEIPSASAVALPGQRESVIDLAGWSRLRYVSSVAPLPPHDPTGPLVQAA